MKKSALLGFVFILALGGGLPASAQPDPGDVGIFADAAGTLSTAPYASPYIPLHLYVIGFDLDGQVAGFEFSLQFPGPFAITGPIVDPETSSASPYFAGPSPINTGSGLAPIIETGGCINGLGALVLAHYVGIFFAPIPPDATICIGATEPSSFSPAAPGYLQCDGALVPFGFAQSGGALFSPGCMVLNPHTDPVCCYRPAYSFTVEDVLALPGSSAEVPVALSFVMEYLCSSVAQEQKTSCFPDNYTGLSFDLTYDSQYLSWDGVAHPAWPDLPYAATETDPGVVHVDFGWRVRASMPGSLELPAGENLARLGFVLSSAGGTTVVQVTGIVADSEFGQTLELSDTSFLVSDDPAVQTTSLSIGALKARY